MIRCGAEPERRAPGGAPGGRAQAGARGVGAALVDEWPEVEPDEELAGASADDPLELHAATDITIAEQTPAIAVNLPRIVSPCWLRVVNAESGACWTRTCFSLNRLLHIIIVII